MVGSKRSGAGGVGLGGSVEALGWEVWRRWAGRCGAIGLGGIGLGGVGLGGVGLIGVGRRTPWWRVSGVRGNAPNRRRGV
jgi:hypothetical protein